MKFETYLLINELVNNLTVVENGINNIKINYTQAFLYNVFDNSNIGSVNLNWIGKDYILNNVERIRNGSSNIIIHDNIINTDFISISNTNIIDYQKIIICKTTTNNDVEIVSVLDGNKMYLLINIK